jgi:glycosyltransferase involved in cell wall biosynthesis
MSFLEQFEPKAIVKRLENLLTLDALKSKHVLHVGTGNLFGGVENIMLSIARVTASEGRKHAFAYCYEGRLAEELRLSGAEMLRYPAFRYSNPFSLVHARNHFSRLLEVNSFETVIFYAPWTYDALSGIAVKMGAKIVFWAMNYLGKGILDLFMRWRCPNYLLACSQDVLNSYAGFKKLERSQVVYPPVEGRVNGSNEKIETKKKVGADQNAAVILMASRLDFYKGHTLLIQGLGELVKRSGIPNWQVWIAGGVQKKSDLKYLQNLKKLAGSLGLENKILWLGQRNDVLELMRCADVFCQPNIGPEPFGVVFVEAQMAGCRVITTNMGGAREAVEKCTANRLIDKPCPFLLADCLQEVLKEKVA